MKKVLSLCSRWFYASNDIVTVVEIVPTRNVNDIYANKNHTYYYYSMRKCVAFIFYMPYVRRQYIIIIILPRTNTRLLYIHVRYIILCTYINIIIYLYNIIYLCVVSPRGVNVRHRFCGIGILLWTHIGTHLRILLWSLL